MRAADCLATIQPPENSDFQTSQTSFYVVFLENYVKTSLRSLKITVFWRLFCCRTLGNFPNGLWPGVSLTWWRSAYWHCPPNHRCTAVSSDRSPLGRYEGTCSYTLKQTSVLTAPVSGIKWTQRKKTNTRKEKRKRRKKKNKLIQERCHLKVLGLWY